MIIKVRFQMDQTYEVVLVDDNLGNPLVVFSGTIAECEAYIRLREGGYLR